MCISILTINFGRTKSLTDFQAATIAGGAMPVASSSVCCRFAVLSAKTAGSDDQERASRRQVLLFST
jgi:hypothetical protein